jgi:AcrR family transcriptional regulator
MSASTKERIVTEALRLFGERGFRGTTVTEIESAAGLSPGSGGLYSHFRSKEEVLAAAIDHAVQLAEAGFAAMQLLPLGDTRAELTLIVRGSLLFMDTWRDLMRVLLREAEQHPQIMRQARDQMLEGAYRWFSDWLAGKAKAGEVADADFDVVAAMWLGAANQYWIVTSLLDGPPLAVDEDRFVSGWVDLLMRVLTPAPHPKGPKR